MLICIFQCSALLDDVNKEDYTEDIKEEYEDIRIDHYDGIRASVIAKITGISDHY